MMLEFIINDALYRIPFYGEPNYTDYRFYSRWNLYYNSYVRNKAFKIFSAQRAVTGLCNPDFEHAYRTYKLRNGKFCFTIKGIDCTDTAQYDRANLAARAAKRMILRRTYVAFRLKSGYEEHLGDFFKALRVKVDLDFHHATGREFGEYKFAVQSEDEEIIGHTFEARSKEEAWSRLFFRVKELQVELGFPDYFFYDTMKEVEKASLSLVF